MLLLVRLPPRSRLRKPGRARAAGADASLPSRRARPEAERRARIEEALRARAYERAETLLLEAVEREPRSAELLRLLGGVFFLRGNYLGAAIAFKKAEALAPLDERSRFTLAMSYVVMGRRDWARPELAKLAASAPRNPLYVYWTARLDYDDGQYAAAVGGFLRGDRARPPFMKAHDNLGLCYDALGRFDEALASYGEAVRLNRSPGLAVTLATLEPRSASLPPRPPRRGGVAACASPRATTRGSRKPTTSSACCSRRRAARRRPRASSGGRAARPCLPGAAVRSRAHLSARAASWRRPTVPSSEFQRLKAEKRRWGALRRTPRTPVAPPK